MKRILAALAVLTLTACSSEPKAPELPQVIPQTINNTHVTNYGDAGEPPCINRGDFTYCRTCYQYDGMRRQSCYWQRAQ